MAPGKHGRSRQKETRRILSIVTALVIVAVGVGVILVIEHQHDANETATDGSLPAALIGSNNSTSTTSRVDTSNPSNPSEPSATSGTSTTPAPPTTTADAQSSQLTGLAGHTVVIDPGHDGLNGSHPDEINRQVPAGGFTKACDTTGTETNDGYPEHAFTFDVSMRLAQILRGSGATVVLTRTNDTGVGPCVNQRAAVGNDNHAAVAVSIHADGGPPGGRGFHVLPPAGCNGCVNDIVAPSAVLADDLRDAFRADTPMPTSTYLGSNGIFPRTDLAGLNLSTVPKVFIECGNMRNATDASILKDPSFHQQAAEAIAVGIATYLRTN